MKTFKKSFIITSLIAILICTFSLISNAATYGNLTYTISNNSITITDCEQSAVTVYIPSEIEGIPVKYIGDYAFYNCEKLKSVKVPDSVIHIGGHTFEYCNSLEEMVLPFIGSSRGKTDTPDSIFRYIFGWDETSRYGSYYEFVYNSSTGYTANYRFVPSSLKRITITDETIVPDNAFYGCSSVIEININDGVKTIHNWAFGGCKSLETISIPENIENIGDCVFYNCRSLKSIKLHDGITSIGEKAFYDCDLLENIDIPASVTSIEYATFAGCDALESINIHDGINYVGESAFENCDNLCNVMLSNSVTSINAKAFYNCTKLETVYVPDGITSIGSQAFYNCKNLKSIIIPEGVTSIGTQAFYNCKNLKSIIVPEGVNCIGDKAFYNCSNINKIVIPKSVTSISAFMFYGCNSLEEIVLPFIGSQRGNNRKIDSVFGYVFGYTNTNETGTVFQVYSGNTSTGSAYYYIPSSLKKVTIIDETKIPEGAFYNCVNLTDVTFLNKDIDNYSGYRSFYNCINLENIIIPYFSIDFFDVETVGYRDSVAGYTYLYSTDYRTSTYYANPKSLKTVVLTNTKSVPEYAFKDCYNLEKVTLPDGITDIGTRSFYGCSDLKDIVIPNSVINIGGEAFSSDCKLYYNGSQKQWSNISNYNANCKYNDDYITFENNTCMNVKKGSISINVRFSLSYGVDYLISTIKYPKYFSVKEIINKDFVENTIDTQILSGEYNLITIISTFDYNSLRTDAYSGYTPYEIIFDTSTCPIGTYTIEFGENTIAIGDEEYGFESSLIDVFVPDSLSICGYDKISNTSNYMVCGKNSENVPVVWSVDNEQLASINECGELTPLVEGVVVVKAAYKYDETIYATKKIVIQRNAEYEIEILGNNVVCDGEKFSVKLTPISLENAYVKWSVDDESVATISDDGVLTALSSGEVRVFATVDFAESVGITASKRITIPKVSSVIDSLVFDIGEWDKPFVPYERNYTVVVPANTASIAVTGSFTGGSLKCNATTMLNGRARTITLDSDVTTLTLARANVGGKNDSSYTVTIVKSVTYITANVSVLNGKYHFEVDTIALPEGYESASVVVAVYDENGTFVTMQTKPVTSDNTTASFDFDVDDVYCYQVMLFDALDNMIPLCTSVKDNI